MIPVLPA